jgi:hypothetical protein
MDSLGPPDEPTFELVNENKMKITRRQLRRIIREVSIPTLQQWANQHNLPIDLDPITGEEVVLIDDEFAMRQGIPDGVQWNVERSYDDDGWIVSIPNTDPLEFEEISYDSLGDIDDIEAQIRGY